ncbi:MAG TPA: hypothetical protein VFN11_19410 [Ktedonobacterales bacterium]|nr:hypothetical protein [Ktedonobacterales bacterium]
MSVPEIADMPLWWLDKASIGIEAQIEIAKKRQERGGVQRELDRIHGGR